MQSSEIKSLWNTTLKVLWIITFLWLVYVSGKKVAQYLLTNPPEQMAKEIILAYKKTIPNWSDTLFVSNENNSLDTVFIDVINDWVNLHYKMSSLLLLENGRVVAHKQDLLSTIYNINTLEVFSIDQFESDKLFEDILYKLEQQQKIENGDYKTLQNILENEDLESL